jgi:hypothetical protein
VVEGQAGRRPGQDCPENRLEVVKDFAGRNPHRLYARPGKPFIPCPVALRPVSPAVCFAVDLDRETGVAAVEIEAVWAGRMLAVEFEAARRLTQFPPEQDFR